MRQFAKCFVLLGTVERGVQHARFQLGLCPGLDRPIPRLLRQQTQHSSLSRNKPDHAYFNQPLLAEA